MKAYQRSVKNAKDNEDRRARDMGYQSRGDRLYYESKARNARGRAMREGIAELHKKESK